MEDKGCIKKHKKKIIIATTIVVGLVALKIIFDQRPIIVILNR